MRAASTRPVTSDWDWQLRAACRSADPDLFFGPAGERGARRLARETAAKRLCARCFVVDACLQHALAVPERDGVWGGLTESEIGDARATRSGDPGVDDADGRRRTLAALDGDPA
jgi:WhiB family redox-sensing transcriptional regulator